MITDWTEMGNKREYWSSTFTLTFETAETTEHLHAEPKWKCEMERYHTFFFDGVVLGLAGALALRPTSLDCLAGGPPSSSMSSSLSDTVSTGGTPLMSSGV